MAWRLQALLRGGLAAPLEVLNRTFVLFGRFARREGPEVATLTGLWILLSRIKAIFARFQLTDHGGPVSQSNEPEVRAFRRDLLRAQSAWRCPQEIDRASGHARGEARRLRQDLIGEDPSDADARAPPEIVVIFLGHSLGCDQRAFGEHVAADEIAHQLEIRRRARERIGLRVSTTLDHPAGRGLRRTRGRFEPRTDRMQPGIVVGL